MSARPKSHATGRDGKLPSLPLKKQTWLAIANSLSLSPQQIRIVELILRGQQDKEIAQRLELSVPTVRTYLGRIYDRVGVSDRLALVLHVFALAQRRTSSPARRQQR